MDKLAVVKKNYKCNFCGIVKNDCLKYGPMYEIGNIRAHYYCVLLSNRLIQNGNDNEGILGFLLSDIQKELERTSSTTCVYCKKGNATISCAAKKCRRSFHLPCGIKGGSLHEFVDKFKSFCHKHRPSQNIPSKIYRNACKIVIVCCICFQKVNVKDKINSLWAPCCVRTWYHRSCIQKLAYSSGYFFKCPACNDVNKFNKWMQKFGVFIPQQDASWELDPNAFEDLLYRHDRCDAEICKCPDGRQKNKDNTVWEIILCESCASQGIHVACGNLKFLVRGWECPTCWKVSQNLKSLSKSSDSVEPNEGSSKLSKPTENCQKKRQRGSEDLKNSVLDKRKRRKTSVEEEQTEERDEIEIDVETVEEESKDKDVSELVDLEPDIFNLDVIGKEEIKFQEVLAGLKPGPLSYKLSLLKKIDEASPSKKKSGQSDSYELIELIDSDDELEDDNAKPPKALNDIDLIFREELRKISVEEFVDINETENEAFKSSPEEKVTYPMKFLPSKWEVDDQLLCLHEIETMSAIIKGVNNYNAISSGFFLPSPKGKIKHHGCSEEEILTQERQLDKSKIDFIKEEEDLKAVSDDEVIILNN